MTNPQTAPDEQKPPTGQEPRLRTHGWTSGPPISEFPHLTGEEILLEWIAGRIPEPSICSTMGFHLTEVKAGTAVFEGEVGDHLFNPMNTVHGGYLATLLDSALGCAVLSRLPAGVGYTTTQLNVHMLRPLFADSELLRCEGVVLHVGRTMATAEARVVGAESGKLYAHATTTCAILRPRPAA
ncbi:PaaI family thioesterase [Kitasatospora cathayae]|uniref:PaaI family thioesterase n=1 Tax=Kitasatospora cathayae TaxID=3004092 RepID=A0ABY7QDL1_9ACTN|nr:PaaI family thioesterase [Kitasatospora sp. HUAS 3-15]WBP90697.1 PaaI family thioesterase [Kitasatospora sp. HUAS 3-15]